MKNGSCVDIITNVFNNIYCTGVTSDLRDRIWEHKNGVYPKSFTSKYKFYKLVYFQFFPNVEEAIREEKRIKGGNRNQKINLIKCANPTWLDLFETLN